MQVQIYKWLLVNRNVTSVKLHTDTRPRTPFSSSSTIDRIIADY